MRKTLILAALLATTASAVSALEFEEVSGEDGRLCNLGERGLGSRGAEEGGMFVQYGEGMGWVTFSLLGRPTDRIEVVREDGVIGPIAGTLEGDELVFAIAIGQEVEWADWLKTVKTIYVPAADYAIHLDSSDDFAIEKWQQCVRSQQ